MNINNDMIHNLFNAFVKEITLILKNIKETTD